MTPLAAVVEAAEPFTSSATFQLILWGALLVLIIVGIIWLIRHL